MSKPDFHLLVAGVPGAMAEGCVQAALDRGLNVIPISLAGSKSGSHPVCTEELCVEVKLFPKEQHDQAIDEALNSVNGDVSKILVIDYTSPAAVEGNIELYLRRGLSFVMGTTGGHSADPSGIIKKIEASSTSSGSENGSENGGISGISAVVAPNMNKQIVAFQAMMDYGAKTFPGAFNGFGVSIKESHQKTKKDTSGTAKAVCASFAELIGDGSKDASVVTQEYIGGIDKIRTDERAIGELGVPEAFLDGHAFHTYKLISDSVNFEFQHNVCGRRSYCEGSVDAAIYLYKQLKAGHKGRCFNMMDVLKGA